MVMPRRDLMRPEKGMPTVISSKSREAGSKSREANFRETGSKFREASFKSLEAGSKSREAGSGSRGHFHFVKTVNEMSAVTLITLYWYQIPVTGI